jgi:hypothetical protein
MLKLDLAISLKTLHSPRRPTFHCHHKDDNRSIQRAQTLSYYTRIANSETYQTMRQMKKWFWLFTSIEPALAYASLLRDGSR